MNYTSSDIARVTGGRLIGAGQRPVVEAVLDHRLLPREHGLFLALEGERTDGHRFVKDAAAAGAAAAVVRTDRVQELADLVSDMDLIVVDDVAQALWAVATANRKRFDIPAVGITGSSGKTTTRSLVQTALEATLANGCCTHGNQNNLLGVPLTLCRLCNGDRYLVAELGTNAFGEIESLSDLLRPSVGVITMVARAHLEGFGDVQGVLREKTALARAVPRDGVVIIPSYDALLSGARTGWTASTLTFGYDAGDTVRIISEQEGSSVSGLLDVAGARVKLTLPVCGVFNIRNGAAALAVVHVMGGDISAAADAMQHFRPEGMRMEMRRWGTSTVILDAYNANPESMKSALETLSRQQASRRIAVLGVMLEMGAQSDAVHREVGALASCAGLDLVVFLEGEDGAYMAGANGAVNTVRAKSHAHAAALVADAAVDGSAILIKGSRGAAMEKVFKAFSEETD